MDAWELDDIEAARVAHGVRYEEFHRVPDLSAGLYVLEAGATDLQSPHTEDELYYVVRGRAPGHGRRRGPRRRAGIRGLRRRDGPASVPRHHRAARAARRVRACGGRSRLTRPSAVLRSRPDRLDQSERELRAAPDVVVAEEHERIDPVSQERLAGDRPTRRARPGRSRADGAGGTGTAPCAGSWAAIASSGSSVVRQRGSGRGQRRERLVDVPARDPGTRPSAAGPAATRRGTRQASRHRAANRRAPGTGRRPAAPRTPGTDRSARAAPAVGALNERNEPPRCALTTNRNVGGVAAEPRCHLGRRRLLVEGVVELDRLEHAPRSGSGTRRLEGPSGRTGATQPGYAKPLVPANSRPDTAAVRPGRAASVSAPSGAQTPGSVGPAPARSATACIARPTASSCPGSRTSRKWSSMPRRWVRDAARSRRMPASVRTASAPRASETQALRSTSPSSTRRSMSRVTPLLLRTTRSESWRIRIRRPGASAMFSRASYSATDRSCSARSSSSRRRATRAWACRNERHGPRRGSCAVSRRSAVGRGSCRRSWRGDATPWGWPARSLTAQR